MKRLVAFTPLFGVQHIQYLLIGALIIGAGCVSQQMYDKAKADADDVARALESAQNEIKELDQRIAALQAMNKKEDAATAELRAAIQREQETGPMLRQRADEKLAALQTQVAYLVNQNRLLGQKMADAKQEGVSLQASVTQYKQELQESRLLSVPMASPEAAQPAPSPTLTPVVPVPTPPAVSAQQAQATPNAPTKPATAPRSAKAQPAQADDSWTGIIKNWVSSLWGWIFG